MGTDFNQTSYELHEKHLSENLDKETLESWKRKDTVDYWRHENMYKSLLPFIQSYPDAKWLTVGDGRYGTDANYLLSNGVKHVTATDISDTLLIVAKADGFIDDYKAENAERLSFADNSYDFVLCKESYHHFPRPAIALYEMLRVAKNGVILIEPIDKNINFSNENFFVRSIRSLMNNIQLQIHGINKYDGFETIGNYIYTTSEREINKIALALNFKHTYFKHQNDYYIAGAEQEKLAIQGPLFKQISNKIKLYDFLSSIGLMQYGLLVSVVAKETFSEACQEKLKQSEYHKYTLPINPYV